jgi:Tfp pilus assembly protein PilX
MRQPELKFRGARGFLLIVAILVLVVVAVAIAALGNMTSADVRSSSEHAQSEQAYFAATSGIEYAKSRFLTGTACGAGLNATAAVGNGSFTVNNATQYAPTPTTTAAGGVTAIAKTIPVLSTAGYAPYGRIVIDSEEMYYGAISGNNFINVVRGYGNTIAATHGTVSAVPVVQSLCNIRSIGTAGTANRNLTANMPLQMYFQGQFNSRTTAGTQSIAAPGFRPAAVIFYWTRQTGAGLDTGANLGMGFASVSGGAVSQYGAAVAVRNGQNPNSQSFSSRRDSTGNVIIFMDPTVGDPPGMTAQASLQSLDASGFTLNWAGDPGGAYIVNYIALGGDTSAAVGSFNLANVAGAQASPATGFRPSFVMFLHAGDGASDTDNADAELGLGFAQSASARGATVYASENVKPTAPGWQQLTDKAIAFLSHTTGGLPAAAGQADFVSMDNSGFTIDVTTPSGAGTWGVGYLALRGARINTGAFNEITATGTQSPAILAFKPKGVMLASSNSATGVGVNAARLSIGAAGLGPGGAMVNANIWAQDLSGQSGGGPNSTRANMYSDAANIISMGLNSATSNIDQATLQSLNLGGFTLDWPVVSGTAREILYWAIGPRNFDDTKELY